jgi:hypothetical protein
MAFARVQSRDVQLRLTGSIESRLDNIRQCFPDLLHRIIQSLEVFRHGVFDVGHLLLDHGVNDAHLFVQVFQHGPQGRVDLFSNDGPNIEHVHVHLVRGSFDVVRTIREYRRKRRMASISMWNVKVVQPF